MGDHDQSRSKSYPNDEKVIAEALRLFERLNDTARNIPRFAPLEGAALDSFKSFQQTAERLKVLPAR